MPEEKKGGALRGLLFPASMFFGLGIGLAFGNPGVGVLIGMGVGFLLMGLVRTKAEPVEIMIPSSIFGYFIMLLGIALVITGTGLIWYPNLLYPYITGAFIALFGVGFITLGVKAVKKEKTIKSES